MPTPDPPSPDAFALVTVTHNSAAALRALLVLGCAAPPGRAGRRGRLRLERRQRGGGAAGSPRPWSSALSENVGFGRANNRGLAEVSEPVAVLVNPDVELLDDSLRALAARPQRGPSGCSPRWCSIPTGRARTPCTRCRPGAADLVRALVPPALRCRAARAPGWRRGGRRRRGGWAGRSGARWPRAPTRCGGWGRLTRRSSSTARTWSSACARRRRRRADVVLARGPGPSPPRPLLGSSPSAASPSRGWPRPATTSCAGAWAGGGRRSTTRSRR